MEKITLSTNEMIPEATLMVADTSEVATSLMVEVILSRGFVQSIFKRLWVSLLQSNCLDTSVSHWESWLT